MAWERGVRWVGSLAVCAVGCGPNVGAGEGAGSASGSGSATDSDSASDTSDGEDSDTATQPTATTVESTTGLPPPVLCEGSEASCHIYPPACPERGCGGYGWLDEDGCVRETCSWDDDCGNGQQCYRPPHFAHEGCLPTGFGCEDDPAEQACLCGGTLDCNMGIGVCIDEADYPPPTLQDQVGDIDNSCAPNDGVAFVLRLGGVGTCFPDETRLELSFFHAIDVGVHRFDTTLLTNPLGDGQGTMVIDEQLTDVVAAEVVIDTFEGGTASGSYRVWLGQEEHVAGSFQAEYCDTPPMCG